MDSGGRNDATKKHGSALRRTRVAITIAYLRPLKIHVAIKSPQEEKFNRNKSLHLLVLIALTAKSWPRILGTMNDENSIAKDSPMVGPVSCLKIGKKVFAEKPSRL